MARVRIKGWNQVESHFQEMADAFEGQSGFRVRIINELEYFFYVEYGTSRMAARAMVADSIEEITEMIAELWKGFDGPFTPTQLILLFTEVKEKAIAIIQSRTPVRTGNLQRGFEGFIEELEA